MNTEVQNPSYSNVILNLINAYISDICNTSITPTSEVIDVLLDIRNLTAVWESVSPAPVAD